jgi:alkanesulfonate monooxygenase
MRPLRFGWYPSTHDDTTAYGLPEARMPGSPELSESADSCRLDPLGALDLRSAFVAAHSARIKPLVAARPIRAANNRGRLAT